MIIRDASNLFSIEGHLYSAGKVFDERQTFTKERIEEILKEFVSNKGLCIFQASQEYAVYIYDERSKEDVLVTGNALLMALCLKDYDTLRELVKHFWLADGRVFRFPIEDEECSVISSPVLIMELLLSEEILPEDIRLLLLETLAKQNAGPGFFMEHLQWPGENLQECLLWSKKIVELNKFPEIYEKLVTETFICEYLWSVSQFGNSNLKQVVTKLKPVTRLLHDTEMMWRVVKKNIPEDVDNDEWYDWNKPIKYMKLWKAVTGQEIQLSVKNDRSWKRLTNKNGDCSEFLNMIFETVDYIKDANALKKDKLYETLFQQGNEMRLFSALKINLITKRMIPSAMDYIQEKQQIWAVPMLMLKQHGEL